MNQANYFMFVFCLNNKISYILSNTMSVHSFCCRPYNKLTSLFDAESQIFVTMAPTRDGLRRPSSTPLNWPTQKTAGWVQASATYSLRAVTHADL